MLFPTDNLPKVYCIFQTTFTNCSRDNDEKLDMICQNHLDLFFNITIERDQLFTKHRSFSIDRLAVTKSYDDIFLPFPFKYPVDNNGIINFGVEPCLSSDGDHLAIVSNFGNILNLSEREKKLYPSIFYSIVANGFINVNSEIISITKEFSRYLTAFRINLIKNAWKDIKFYVVYTNVNGVKQTIAVESKYIPIFYLILFSYGEISNHISNNAGALTIQNNVILDYDKKAFIYINITETNPLYLRTDTSTFSSNIIVGGEKRVDGQINLFNSGIRKLANVFELANIVRMCNPP